MALSSEWTEWHLTPKGWQKGDWKTDFSSGTNTTPSDTVLSKRYEETLKHSFQLNEESEVIWSSGNKDLIAELEKKFPYPNSL